MGGHRARFQVGRPDHVAEDAVTIRNSWVRVPTGLPHWGQKLARRPGCCAVRASRHARSIWTIRQWNRPVGDSSSKRLDRQEFGYSNGAGWLGCAWAGTKARSGAAPERKRSARDYEQALRRQELAAGRALVQPAGRRDAGGRGLARRASPRPCSSCGASAATSTRRSRACGPAAGPHPGRAGVGAGGAGPVRGRARRRRGAGRALGGPPRPARRRARPPPAAASGTQGERGAGPVRRAAGEQRQAARAARARERGRIADGGPCSARTTSIPRHVVHQVEQQGQEHGDDAPHDHAEQPDERVPRNTVPAGKATSRLKLPASVTDVNTPMLTSTNQMTANTSRLISIRQK